MTIVAPVELARRAQWVAWRLTPREGEPKPTKLPYNARTGKLASTTDPATWSTFEEASTFCQRERCSGVGYVLSPDDPYVGVDLDSCRNPESGKIEGWAQAIMKRLSSYTEISPSGTGLRIFVRGELPPYGRRKGKIEIYSQARFLTITGDHVLGYPDTIQDRARELLDWHRDVFGLPQLERSNGHVQRSPVQLADADLLLKARSADNGTKFWALWNGDYTGYGSQSEADLALLNELAFWTGPDEARLDQLFRSSGLMREKWEREDYRARTITKALEGRTDFYGDLKPGPRLIIPGQTVDEKTGEILESAWQSLAELVRGVPEQQPELIQGLFRTGRTHWMYSAPGAGKTIFVIAALMHVAAGKEFCQRSVQQCPVILIEEDSPFGVISDYVAMLAEIYGFNLEEIPFWINRQQGFRLTSLDSTNSIMDAFHTAPQWPGVVAIDACERVIPSDRFSSKELEPLSALLQKLSAINVSSIVIDHTRKNNVQTSESDPLDLLYGGRTKSAISDAMIYFSGKINQSARVKFTKFRGQMPGEFDVKFDADSGFSLRTQRRELSETERKIMRALNDVPGAWMTYEEVSNSTGMSERSLQRPLIRLAEEGMAERHEDLRPARFKAVSSGINFTV